MNQQSMGFFAACLLTLSAIAHGVEVQTWSTHTATDFEKGQASQIVVTSQDRVQLARQLTRLADLEVDHVWAMTREPDGSLLAATGGPGLVVRIPPTGPLQRLHEAEDQQIFALALAPDGKSSTARPPAATSFGITRTEKSTSFSRRNSPTSGEWESKGPTPSGRRPAPTENFFGSTSTVKETRFFKPSKSIFWHWRSVQDLFMSAPATMA